MDFLKEIARQGQEYRDRVAVQARKLGLIQDEEYEDEPEEEGEPDKAE